MTAITADFFRKGLLPSNSPGSSAAYDEVRTSLEEARARTLSVASALQSAAAATLARIEVECDSPGWDGYEARAITSNTCNRAFSFIAALPSWMEPPAIVPESDGQIAIEWEFGPSEIFSVSIGEQGPIYFAGIFGKNKERHGVEPFEGSIPEEILDYINKLLRIPATRPAA